MSLSPIGNPAHETIRGVRFAMLGSTGLVAVLVTRAALEEIEAPRPQKGGYLGRFERHRGKFEKIQARCMTPLSPKPCSKDSRSAHIGTHGCGRPFWELLAQ